MIKVREMDSLVVAYHRGEAFDWDADGDLTVLDGEGNLIAVHFRGTWRAVWIPKDDK